MSKFEVSFSSDSIVFLNKATNKGETLKMDDAMSDDDAIKAIRREQDAAVSASRGAVSLLVHIMDNPRLDSYRGTCPVSSKPPSELNAAIRDLEKEYLKPMFINPIMDKLGFTLTNESTPEEHARWNKQLSKAESDWQAYIKALNAGGSYAVARGHVAKLFAYTGNLPTRNGKLFTVAAIKKLLENLEKPEQENTGITGKLITLASQIDTHNGDNWDILGDVASGIAALRAMLATYEGVQRENVQAAMVTHKHKSVGDVTNKAIAAAMQVPALV
jgi:hypothetical protein